MDKVYNVPEFISLVLRYCLFKRVSCWHNVDCVFLTKFWSNSGVKDPSIRDTWIDHEVALHGNVLFKSSCFEWSEISF